MYLKNEALRYGPDLFGSGQGSVAGCCEHSNEPIGSIKAWNFLDLYLLRTMPFTAAPNLSKCAAVICYNVAELVSI
jgi:hypothetical protein